MRIFDYFLMVMCSNAAHHHRDNNKGEKHIMHEPNPISLAAKASGEPEFREVGVGPWAETHPGEERPDNPQSSNYDERYDSQLLDEGDRRNVLDRYRYWTVPAIKADLDARGRHAFEVAVENWTHDFNIGSMVRTANAFQAAKVHIVGPHKWNRKGALMTELYQHVEHHPSIKELVDDWHQRIAQEIADAQSELENLLNIAATNDDAHAAISHATADSNAIAAAAGVSAGIASSNKAVSNESVGIAVPAALQSEETAAIGDPADIPTRIADAQHRLDAARAARVIALDIIPGAVPIETYRFPERCLMLFGAEGPGLSEKALELADDVVYISQFGSVRSINAGAAAAVSMHCWIAQHAAPAI